MIDVANYVIESGISLAVLFALYWFFLRKETYFRFNRLYLLGTLVVACILPLGNLSLFSSVTSSLSALPLMAEAFRIPELSVGKDTGHAVNTSFNWWLLIIVIYLTGVSLLFVRMSLGIARVIILKRKGERNEIIGYTLIHIPREIAPFSFFRTIYLNSNLIDNSNERYIIDHEIIHIRQGHSYDNLFVEFLLILFWFNPFMWLLKSALRDTHEYLADSGVLNQSASPVRYQSLLLSQITGSLPIVVTSSFNSTLKNRIKMMYKNKSSLPAKFKPLLLVPVLAGLVLLFACEEKDAEPPEKEYTETSPQQMEVPEGEEVFYIVEDMPTFNGDDPAIEFRIYIGQNLRYPAIAVENGVSGRVIVQFAVNSRGEVVDAVVVRSVDEYLDKEAIRLVMSSPKWTPGKQKGKAVKVLYTFPINFVLQ